MEYFGGFPSFKYFMVLEPNKALDLKSSDSLQIKKNGTKQSVLQHYIKFPWACTSVTISGHPGSKGCIKTTKYRGKASKI